jgi:hypothetical protein
MLADLQAGRFQRSASTMEAIANHYNIPSIHFGVEVAKRVSAGTLIFKGTKEQAAAKDGPMVFSTDGVHPIVETGHEIYQQVLAHSFLAMKGVGGSGPHQVITALRPDHWEQAKIVPITASMLKGAWTKLDPAQPGRAKDFSRFMPEMWFTNEPGASLEFTVEGSVAKLYQLLGPDGGELEVRIAEEAPRKALLIDSFCTYHRLATLNLFSVPAPERKAVKISLTGTMPDKAKILSEANRAVMEKNPAPYQKIAWHAGSLLIVGEIVKSPEGK